MGKITVKDNISRDIGKLLMKEVKQEKYEKGECWKTARNL